MAHALMYVARGVQILRCRCRADAGSKRELKRTALCSLKNMRSCWGNRRLLTSPVSFACLFVAQHPRH